MKRKTIYRIVLISLLLLSIGLFGAFEAYLYVNTEANYIKSDLTVAATRIGKFMQDHNRYPEEDELKSLLPDQALQFIPINDNVYIITRKQSLPVFDKTISVIVSDANIYYIN